MTEQEALSLQKGMKILYKDGDNGPWIKGKVLNDHMKSVFNFLCRRYGTEYIAEKMMFVRRLFMTRNEYQLARRKFLTTVLVWAVVVVICIIKSI